jgi:hypothetical protein
MGMSPNLTQAHQMRCCRAAHTSATIMRLPVHFHYAKFGALALPTNTTYRVIPRHERSGFGGHVFVLVAPGDGVLFRYTPKYDGPTVEKLFGGYQGTLVTDASANHNGLFGPGKAREAGCWSHARRRFFKAYKAGAGEPAAFALQTIQALFRIEVEIALCSPDERLAARESRSAPLVETLFTWVEEQLARVPKHAPLREGLVYLHNQREALRPFLSNGEIPIHNNACERALRRIVKGRQNWLFHGSDEHARRACALSSLIASCQMHGLDPEFYLQEILTVAPSYPLSRMLDLSPKNWVATRKGSSPRGGSSTWTWLGSPARNSPSATAERAASHASVTCTWGLAAWATKPWARRFRAGARRGGGVTLRSLWSTSAGPVFDLRRTRLGGPRSGLVVCATLALAPRRWTGARLVHSRLTRAPTAPDGSGPCICRTCSRLGCAACASFDGGGCFLVSSPGHVRRRQIEHLRRHARDFNACLSGPLLRHRRANLRGRAPCTRAHRDAVRGAATARWPASERSPCSQSAITSGWRWASLRRPARSTASAAMSGRPCPVAMSRMTWTGSSNRKSVRAKSKRTALIGGTAWDIQPFRGTSTRSEPRTTRRPFHSRSSALEMTL